jgi:hypothetical protein
MRRILLLTALLLPAAALGCRDDDAEPRPAATDDVPLYKCTWRTDKIKIDGILNEAAWDHKNVEVLDNFMVSWEKRKPKTATKARLVWDNDYLYFCAEMEDSDLYADVKEPNGKTWTNDVFELFFKPSAKKLDYYEFQVNAANTPLQLHFPSRGAGGYQRFAPLTPVTMESTVKLHGTLNNHTDQDKGWTVEGRIPWTAFKATGGRPKSGERWHFALCRYDYSTAFERPEQSTSAPLTQGDFHRYEDYAEIVFVGRE